MVTTIEVRFPLGRFHATPWDRSVNEGVVEWPPSPWRLLRALVSTWYTRWPELPAPDLDGLLDQLGQPPSYRTPPVRPAHTRHYFPDLDHKKGVTGSTDLTLDPYLSLDRDTPLVVQWEAQLPAEQRATLAKLVELVPYLGRADSVCEARLVDTDGVPDASWWRPGASAPDTTRLLAPTQPVQRPILEVSTVEVRKARRTLPPETTWVTYAREAPEPERPRQRTAQPAVEALRLAVISRAPVTSAHGILLADKVHAAAARKLQDGQAGDVFGRKGAPTDHRHAHWLPLASRPEHGARVESLLIWVPDKLSTEQVAAILSIRQVSGRMGGSGETEGYEHRGLPPVELLLQAAGSVTQVAPELCRPARRWRSLTPYLPVRHRKRESLDDFITEDVHAELRYRGMGPARVTCIEPHADLSDRWAREFRRYRLNEYRDKQRRGLGLRLEFPDEVCGPVLLGQLSHFGYGIFIPDSG